MSRVRTIKVRETGDQIDVLAAQEDWNNDVRVTVASVDGVSVTEWWRRRVELNDLFLASDDVVLIASDGVTYLGSLNEVDDSTEGRQATITLR